jgi:multimeric flavodoxin WrbA
MKLISLLGSPHGLKGNTARLLELVVKGAESLGAENETLVLKGDSVLPCMGCDHCHRQGTCVQKDAFESIKHKVNSADGLVLASPNYIFSVSAQLKAFMDRCCGVIHCLGFEGRYGASVVTSGGGDEPPIADYMNHFLMTTGIVPVGAVWATMGAMGEKERFSREIEEKAIALGKKIVTAWQAKEMPPGVAEAQLRFSERMQTLMRYRKDRWPYEYAYWVAHRKLTD